MDTTPELTAAIIYGTVVFSVITVILLLFILVCVVLNRRYLKSRSMHWIEIIPPSTIDKTLESTEQLFTVIHGNRAARSVSERILRRSPVFSFEIVSTKSAGVRYLVQIERKYVATVIKSIHSYLPEAKVSRISYEPPLVDKVIEFKQSAHFVLPITLPSGLTERDPLSYVTGALANLNDEETLTVQMIVEPVKLRKASSLTRKILANENILQQTGGKHLRPLQNSANVATKFANGMTDLIGDVYTGTTYGHKNYEVQRSKRVNEASSVVRSDRPARSLSIFESEVMDTMHRKINQQLFRVNLRVLISSKNKEHASALKTAFDGFSVPPYQSLKAKHDIPLLNRIKVSLGQKRLPSLLPRSGAIFSATELASLYHVPSSAYSRTDNLVSSLSRTLPAPVSLKSDKDLSVLIGENKHHGVTTPIGLTEAERERHLYIIGGTGNGKTTMLFYSILQDIRAGRGVAVLDPHGDLADRILNFIPEGRVEDVVYLNPDDLSHPIGINLLELSDATGDELLREKDLITEATISVLRKIFSEDDSGGHRIEYVLRNAIQTALTLKNPTLFTIFELLNDAKFRRSVVKTLQDKNLKDFWKNELGQAGDFQRVKMAAGITAKIGRFLFSASARRVLEQHKSTIDFEDILATKKILICNFSKGLLGEDTSTLFGTTILAKLQTAALRRARISRDNRSPYYLYVDEFQNFATMSFVQMLSEARKYKLFLTMAEQSTSQQEEQRLVDIILANVGTVVCFRSGSPGDERLVLPLFSPFIQQGEIANLPAYSYYARIAAIDAQEPMSGETVVVNEPGDVSIRAKVIESSRNLYGSTAHLNQPPVVEQSAKPKRTKKQRTGDDQLLATKPLT